MLRFGDGTPFPLDESFLEVLVNAVSACSAMLTATAHMEERHGSARKKQHELQEEERKLERFEQAVRVAAMASVPANPPEPLPADLAFGQTITAMQHALQHARKQLKLTAEANATEFGWDEAAQQVELALGEFFERDMLPGSIWSWSWDATCATPSFEATARGARFTATFDLDYDVLWRAPIRLAALVPGARVDLPRGRWFGKPAVTSIPLDRCVLVSARCDTDGLCFEIRDHARTARGWRIILPPEGAVTATAFDRRGRVLAVAPVDPAQIATLFETVDRQLAARISARRMRSVLLGGVPISQIEDTTAAPRALLDEIGPVVREIRTRSLVPGELSLKRDIAAGVREELFVSRTQLAACYASLPPRYRHLLDAIGVGGGLTGDQAEGQAEANPGATAQVPPHPAAPLLPQRTSAHPPPIPRHSRVSTPTTPVKSLRAIPILGAAASPMA